MHGQAPLGARRHLHGRRPHHLPNRQGTMHRFWVASRRLRGNDEETIGPLQWPIINGLRQRCKRDHALSPWQSGAGRWKSRPGDKPHKWESPPPGAPTGGGWCCLSRRPGVSSDGLCAATSRLKLWKTKPITGTVGVS
jgi:hypothetical protein